MSTAYFIVLDCDDPGFDSFVDGKMLTKYLDDVNEAAARLGLKALEDYAFQDLSEFGGPDMEIEWFEAAEGADWVSSVIQELRSNPDPIRELEAVVEDLEDYLRVFNEAGERGLKWHLELDL